MSKVFYIDPTYIEYRKMWNSDRWKFSGIMVNLTIKQSNDELTDLDLKILDTMNRIVEENDGVWIEEPSYKKTYKRR